MSDLSELYQEVILDHNKSPRNFKVLERATHEGRGFNPLCGDRVHLFCEVKEGRVEEVTFQGSGCAISTASASLLTEAVRGKSREEIEQLIESFARVVRGEPLEGDEELLGKLSIFAGVSEFPTRVKCATLVWHTLLSALNGSKEAEVSTE